jgi:hypothetical protein
MKRLPYSQQGLFMKAKFLIASILLIGSVALASDPPISFVHKYAVGDKDVYSIKMKMTASGGGMGEMNMSMTSTQVVKKVYDNGDADVENSTSDMVIDVAGQHISPPGGPSTTTRVTKFGAPVGAGKAAGRGPNMNFMRYTNYMGDGALSLNTPLKIDSVDPDNPKNSVHGTATLVGTENGLSKIVTSMDVRTADTGDTAMHIDSTSWLGENGKLNRSEAKITNLAMAAGSPMKIDAVELTMERKN